MISSALYKELVMNCFRDIYLYSSPTGDFDKLNLLHDKDWFMDYTISESLMEIIINKYINSQNLSQYEINSFKSSIYLGPSPKFS